MPAGSRLPRPRFNIREPRWHTTAVGFHLRHSVGVVQTPENPEAEGRRLAPLSAFPHFRPACRRRSLAGGVGAPGSQFGSDDPGNLRAHDHRPGRGSGVEVVRSTRSGTARLVSPLRPCNRRAFGPGKLDPARVGNLRPQLAPVGLQSRPVRWQETIQVLHA